MHNRVVRLVHACGAALVLLLLLGVSSMPALAQSARPMDGSIALALANGTTFPYQDKPAPAFSITLTPPTPTGNTITTLGVKIDNTYDIATTYPEITQAGTYSIDASWSGMQGIGVGPHTAIAFFDNSGGSLLSSPVTFTVSSGTTGTTCGSGHNTYKPGMSVPLAVQVYAAGQQLLVSGMTFTVTVSGPVSATYTHLAPQPSGGVPQTLTITAPSQTGAYSITCAYEGSTLYAPSVSQPLALTLSNQLTWGGTHSLGGVHLYTNPTTYNFREPLQIYLVFSPAPGGPIPTGTFGISSAYTYVKPVTIQPDGTFAGTLQTPSTAAFTENELDINYSGDGYYAQTTVVFPLTNPPIPNGSATGVSGGNGGTGAGTGTHSTPTVEPTATGTSQTPTATSAASASLTTSSDQGAGGLPLWIMLLLVIVVVVVGLCAALIVVLVTGRRRGAAPVTSGTPVMSGAPYPPQGMAGWGTPEPPTDGNAPPWPGNRGR